MAVRIRAGGQILCAAMHPAKRGDTYLDDGLSYLLSVELRVLVTEPMYVAGGRGGHQAHGEWWWRDRVPDDVSVDPFYLDETESGVQDIHENIPDPFLSAPAELEFIHSVLGMLATREGRAQATALDEYVSIPTLVRKAREKLDLLVEELERRIDSAFKEAERYRELYLLDHPEQR